MGRSVSHSARSSTQPRNVAIRAPARAAGWLQRTTPNGCVGGRLGHPEGRRWSDRLAQRVDTLVCMGRVSVGILTVLCLVSAACAGTDGNSTGPPDAEADGALEIATLLPVTGQLAPSGTIAQIAVRLAVREVNLAGGVLGRPVVTDQSARTGEDAAGVAAAAAAMLADPARPDAIIGPMLSSSAEVTIPIISDAEVVECAPSTTSPALSLIDSNGYFFRTAPSDAHQGAVLADWIAAEGHRSVVVIAADDAYGRGVADAVRGSAVGGHVEIADVVYTQTQTEDPDAAAAVARLALHGNVDAVLIADTPPRLAAILREMIRVGINPRDRAVYTTESIDTPDLARLVDPVQTAEAATLLSGLKGSAPATRTDPLFLDDLIRSDPGAVSGAYVAQAFDCLNIIALAAESAGSTDPAVFKSAIPGVTRDGTVCRSFRTCSDLLAEGADIDYIGASGELRLSESGEPTMARYELYRFEDGDLVLSDVVEIGSA